MNIKTGFKFLTQCMAAGSLLAFSSVVMAQSALRNHDADQPIDIVADHWEVRQNEDMAVLRGAVEASQGELTLKADTLTVFYQTASEGGNPAITRIDASGHVQAISPSESADGEWGIYDVSRRIITIGGAVTLRRGDSVLEGERLEIDLVSGITRFDGNNLEDDDAAGRVRGRFSLPEDENGDDVGN